MAYYDEDDFEVGLEEIFFDLCNVGFYGKTSSDAAFNKALIKLINNRSHLTKDDEETILKISQQIC